MRKILNAIETWRQPYFGASCYGYVKTVCTVCWYFSSSVRTVSETEDWHNCFLPEALRVDPSAEGLGARLLLECGAGDDEEEEEEDEEEAAGEEVRAADRVGAGETSRSPDSISVKHNPISRVTIGKNTHPYTDKHTLKCVHTTAYCAPLQHTHSSTPMHKQPHTHTPPDTFPFTSHFPWTIFPFSHAHWLPASIDSIWGRTEDDMFKDSDKGQQSRFHILMQEHAPAENLFHSGTATFYKKLALVSLKWDSWNDKG